MEQKSQLNESVAEALQGRKKKYRRRYLDLTWKDLRMNDESKYSFSNVDLKRQRWRTDTDTKSREDRKEGAVKMVKVEALSYPEEYSQFTETVSATTRQDSLACTSYRNPDEVVMSCSENEIPDDESYVYELKSKKAISLCNNTFKRFLLQDYCFERKSLKPRSYVFVERAGKRFAGQSQWIYWCSCDGKRAELLDSLCSDVDIPYESIDKKFPGCVHIAAVCTIVKDMDGVYDISPQHDFEDHSYSFKVPLFSSNSESINFNLVPFGNEGAVYLNGNGAQESGIILPSEQGAVCISCKNQKHTCSHVRYVMELISTGNPPVVLKHITTKETIITEADKKKPRLLSYKKIAFDKSPEMALLFQLSQSFRFNIIEGICYLNVDSDTPCPVCGLNFWKEATVAHSRIVTKNQVLPALVQTRCCGTAGCDGILEFEGQEMGLLVVKSYCITHEVLRNHMHHFLNGRTTIFTQYTVLCEDHADAGTDLSSVLSYHQYLFSWYSFLSLLRIDYEKGFLCSECSTAPEVVIMDATSLAFRKDLDAWQPFLDNTSSSTHKRERVFIQNDQTRKLLTKFTSNGLNGDEMADLKEQLKNHSPSILAVIAIADFQPCNRIHQCQKEWIKLIRSLASNSPACALLHISPRMASLVKSLMTEDVTKNPSTLAILQEEIPVIFNLIHNLAYYPHEVLRPLIHKLWERAKFPFEGVNSTVDELSTNTPCIDNISCFPGLSKVRSRGVYVADKQSNNLICTKRNSRHPALLPGVFTIFCKHGICYGFKVMRIAESPNTAFIVMFEHFQKAPSVIIYDNACNLHQYLLNREPAFFKHSWLLVDRFHWPNHTGCSIGYKLDSYPQFKTINSQIVEQHISRK